MTGTTTYAGTTGTVKATAGGNIVNASGIGGTGQEQIRAQVALLAAGGGIGSGIIDNTLTGTNNTADLNLAVAQLTANAANGDVVLWNRGAVNLADNSSAAGNGYFGINAGGAITQSTGATLTAVAAEFDTMRDTSIGKVTLANAGDLKIGGDNHVGGNYSATSQTGAVSQSGTLNVNGDVTLTGTSITLTGTVKQAGNVVQNGVITNTTGAQIAALSITGNTATVTAYGSGADFDLGTVLTPSVLAALPDGVTTIAVQLGNQITSYSVASLTNDAVVLANANAVSGNWTVRTGDANTSTPTTQVRNYNLTDQSGPVDLGSKNVDIHAARGTAYAAGSQASNVAASASTANTNAGFNVANGSDVTLTQTQTSGAWSIRDAYDVALDTSGNLNLAYLKANNDAILLAGVDNNKNLTVDGEVRTGGSLLGIAGNDVVLNAPADILTQQRLILVADETAGTAIGNGWFRNNGAAQVASATNEITIYAVAGTAPAGYTASHASQVVLGNIADATQPASQWGTAYQTTATDNTGVWYKATLAANPVTPVDPVTPVTPSNPTTPATGVPTELPVRMAIDNLDPETPLVDTNNLAESNLMAALNSGASLDDFLEATASGPCNATGLDRVGRLPDRETGYLFGEARFVTAKLDDKRKDNWEIRCRMEDPDRRKRNEQIKRSPSAQLETK